MINSFDSSFSIAFVHLEPGLLELQLNSSINASKKKKKFGRSRSFLTKQKSEKTKFSILFGKSQPNRMKIGFDRTNFEMLYPNLQIKLWKTFDFEKLCKKSKIVIFSLS